MTVESMEVSQLLEDIRNGDEDAARRLVEEYSSVIRREARLRLMNLPSLGGADPDDVCQSVLQKFFGYVADDRCHLTEASQLIQLLVTMTRRKVVDHWRRQNAAKRSGNHRQVPISVEDLHGLPGDEDTPSRQVSYQELLHLSRQSMSPEEHAIARLRREDKTWQQIADELGGTRESVRRKFMRAWLRVSLEIGIIHRQERRL